MSQTRYDELQQRIDELNRTIDLLESRRDTLASQQREILVAGQDGDDGGDGDDGAERDSEAERRRIKATKAKVSELSAEFEDGAPTERVVSELAVELGYSPDEIEHEIEQLKRVGEVYEPREDHLQGVWL
jgi:replicative DNA helicase Mcm